MGGILSTYSQQLNLVHKGFYAQTALKLITSIFNSRNFYECYTPGSPLKREGKRGRGEKGGCAMAVG